MMKWEDLPVLKMTALDCAFVCTNMREDDFLETSSLTFAKTRDAMIKATLDEGGEHYTVLNRKGEPVIVGGTYYDNPNVATIWLFATDKITKRDWWVATKFITGLIDRMFENGMAHRIQAFSIGWRHVAHKWFKQLGLKQEACLKGFTEDGIDVLIFSKIKE
jgi:hypothetical protein